MSDTLARYEKVADGFNERLENVPATAWDNPAPCEGWVARDVVGHLVEWLPAFFVGMWGLDPLEVPPVADDPAAAWAVVDAFFRTSLADADLATSERDTPMGTKTFADAFDMIATSDVLIHTWDLARATGLDETLDPDEVHAFAAGIEPMDAMLRASGQYGPRVDVPEDADEQTWLLAFLGRHP